MACSADDDSISHHGWHGIENLLEKSIAKTKGENSFTIVVVGKTGCGKSTLIGDILGPNAREKPSVGGGKNPVSTETEFFQIVVNDVKVDVYDTRGFHDTHGGDHEKKTIEFVNEICTNDRNGVLVVCMEMHGRTDTSTAETLALLHKHCGKEIWRFVVIALTKANEYPEKDWLESSKWWEVSWTVLRRKFDLCLNDNRQMIEHLFTDQLRESCRIEMSKEEFEALQIPIVPVARLNPKDTKRMENVGYGFWFSYFLLQCTIRERDVGLVAIHKDQLSFLPRKMERFIKQQIEPEVLEKAKQLAEKNGITGALYLIFCQKIYWWLYRKQMICGPRFEKNAL